MKKKNEKLITILEKAKKKNFELLLTHGEIDIIDDAYQSEHKIRVDRSCPPCLASALKTLAKKHLSEKDEKGLADLTVKELKALAEEKGIELEATKKADIVADIEKALNAELTADGKADENNG